MAEETTLEERQLRQLIEHRLFQAIRLGFGIDEAETIAASSVDLHDLERLIDLGCPHDIALEITF